MVDAGDSKSPAERRAGSIPAPGTSDKSQTVSEPLKTRMFIGIAGFLLSHAVSPATMTYRQKGGIYGGIFIYGQPTYRQMARMALTDTFAKNIKPSGAPIAWPARKTRSRHGWKRT